ncbi:MAG: hypothetical protein ACYCS1_07930 [Gammaproteobacteria bacterium]
MKDARLVAAWSDIQAYAQQHEEEWMREEVWSKREKDWVDMILGKTKAGGGSVRAFMTALEEFVLNFPYPLDTAPEPPPNFPRLRSWKQVSRFLFSLQELKCQGRTVIFNVATHADCLRSEAAGDEQLGGTCLLCWAPLTPGFLRTRKYCPLHTAPSKYYFSAKRRAKFLPAAYKIVLGPWAIYMAGQDQRLPLVLEDGPVLRRFVNESPLVRTVELIKARGADLGSREAILAALDWPGGDPVREATLHDLTQNWARYEGLKVVRVKSARRKEYVYDPGCELLLGLLFTVEAWLVAEELTPRRGGKRPGAGRPRARKDVTEES